jgi:GlpG protein
MKITFNSPIILTFALASAIALALGVFTNGWTTKMFFSTYDSSLLSPMTYVRCFTHVLGHASFSHFINNMLLFLLLGPMLEEKYGSERILIVIGATALVTAIINNIFMSTGLLGASGVVFAFIILASMTSFREKEIPLTFIIIIFLYLGREIFNGIFSSDNISQSAHLIGGACGAIAGFVFSPKE